MSILYPKISLSCIVVFIYFIISSSLNAKDVTRDGLYARLTSGINYGKLYEYVPERFAHRYSHGYIYSYNIDVAVGYTFFGSFIPHVSLFRLGTISQNNPRGIDFYIEGWGNGLTYYFMPINIFISISTKIIISGCWRTKSAGDHPYREISSSTPVQKSSRSISGKSSSTLSLFPKLVPEYSFFNFDHIMVGKEFFLSPELSAGVFLSRRNYSFDVKEPYTDLSFQHSNYDYVSYGIDFVLTYN